MLARIASGCAFALLMAGCTQPGPPAGPQFDGAYQGTSRLIRGGGPLCGDPVQSLTIDVRDGTFDYPFLVNAPRTAPLRTQIFADGHFRGDMQFGLVDPLTRSGYRMEWATVAGHMDGPNLEGTIDNWECTRQMSLQRH
jgi:hypothetical protein